MAEDHAFSADSTPPSATGGGCPRRGPGCGLLGQLAYRRLWLARTVSQVGDVAQFTTLALLLVALIGSGFAVSGAVLAEIAPVLLLAPLAGVWSIGCLG